MFLGSRFLVRCWPALVLLAFAIAGCTAETPPPPPLPAADFQKEGEAPEPLQEKLTVIPHLEDHYSRVEEAKDDWSTEQFHVAVKKVLKTLVHAVEEPGALSEESLRSAVAEGAEVDVIRPELETVFQRPDLTVRRGRPDSPPSARSSLTESLRHIRAPFAPEKSAHVKYKIDQVNPGPDGVGTHILFYAHGPGAKGGEVQLRSSWYVEWTGSAEKPRLQTLRTDSLEVVESTRVEPWFADCSEAVMAPTGCFVEQLLPSLEYWRGRMGFGLGTVIAAHHGLSIGDVNGDGLEDLHVCQPGGLPDRLFLQQPDGTVRDFSAEGGIDYLESTRSSSMLDLDNDGDLDLAVLTEASLLILENDGAARFQERQRLRTPRSVSLSAADYDLDGRVDIYVCCYSDPSIKIPPVPYHDSNNGHRNFMLRNEGGFEFTDVTAAVGLDENNRRFSFASSWEDFDRDGDQDLYVANDFGRNNLYRNDVGRFTDIAEEAGVEDISAGMGVSWSDYDLDGDPDLYVSNMYSSAGGRIAYQSRFLAGSGDDIRQSFQRHARGNSLFRNEGNGRFTDVSVEADVTMGRWAWGAEFWDLDNDGLDDLVVPNGFITNIGENDL